MVMSFSVLEARKQLLEKGIVYTYRWNRRKKTGKDWANEKRGKSKMADIFIKEVGNLPPHTVDLFPFYKKSGFKSCRDWIKTIMGIHRPPGHLDGWLYKVTLVSQQLRKNQNE